jgi:GT2 family glycosyltransferase
MIMREAQCDIIIPVWNKPDLTRSCLDSIYAHTHTQFSLILIDNGSVPEMRDFLRDFSACRQNIRLIENDANLGWIKAVNQGMRLSSAPYVLIMNNDTLVMTDDWLTKLIAVAESYQDIGLVNPNFEEKKETYTKADFVEIDFCRGYCALIKRNVIERIGLFDESYGLGYYDDDDYSVRAINAGFMCVRANNVFVEHLRDSTFSDIFKKDERLKLHYRNKMLFYSKWGRRLRLIFIITREDGRDTLRRILLAFVRKQHIVYLWNLTTPFSIPHINIREKKLPPFFYVFHSILALLFNRLKKQAKQYDAIFVDNEDLGKMLATINSRVYTLGADKDMKGITDIIDSMSKVNYAM